MSSSPERRVVYGLDRINCFKGDWKIAGYNCDGVAILEQVQS